MHEFGAHHVPGERVFVPAATDAGEDESRLVGLAINAAREETDFVVLDARSFAAPTIA